MNWVKGAKIVKSWRKHKKFAVESPKGFIHFGDNRYKDFTQHKDSERRKSYLKRATKIRDGKGKLTVNNPYSANYWAARVLWNYKK